MLDEGSFFGELFDGWLKGLEGLNCCRGRGERG